VGEQFGSDWLIESGLAANDRVIVEGLQKAKPGGVVDPQPYAPTNAAPAPPGAPAGGKPQ
jgi:membrane fusion protein (multidrug efflux system)